MKKKISGITKASVAALLAAGVIFPATTSAAPGDIWKLNTDGTKTNLGSGGQIFLQSGLAGLLDIQTNPTNYFYEGPKELYTFSDADSVFNANPNLSTEEIQEKLEQELAGKGEEIPAQTLDIQSVSALNPTTVKVTFNQAVEALTKADVTITNKDNNKVLVKSVILSEDKKSATVEFYDALTAGEYKISVKDAGEGSFKYEIGVPTTIVAETVQKFDASKTGKIVYKVLDENGLDITATLKADEVIFQSTDLTVVNESGMVQKTGTAKSVFVNIVVKKEGSTTELKSNRIAVTTEIAALKEITDFTVAEQADFTSQTYKQNTKVALGDTAKKLHVTGKDQFGETVEIVEAKYESLDLDVAVVDSTTGKIIPIKEGKFAVKVTVGDVTKTVELEVIATAKLTALVADKDNVTLSSEATVPAEVKVVAKDQNGTDFTTTDYSKEYTAIATTEAGKALVNVTLEKDGTVKVTPKSKEAGTATIEVKHNTNTTIKTVFTVKVEKAGAVTDYKVVGFEAKLDKFIDNTEKTPSTATLSVIPVDDNGAQAGVAVTNVSYVVTDKNGEVVPDVGSNGTIDAVDLEVGKYTLTTKVGTVEVSAQEFEVVNTETQPTIEFTATSVTNTNDTNLFEEVKDAIKVIPGTTAQEAAQLKVTGIKFVSTDSTFVDSQNDAFVTEITVKKDGDADLLISEVQIKSNNDASTYTVKLSSNFKLTVSSTIVAAPQLTGVIVPQGGFDAVGDTLELVFDQAIAFGDELSQQTGVAVDILDDFLFVNYDGNDTTTDDTFRAQGSTATFDFAIDPSDNKKLKITLQTAGLSQPITSETTINITDVSNIVAALDNTKASVAATSPLAVTDKSSPTLVSSTTTGGFDAENDTMVLTFDENVQLNTSDDTDSAIITNATTLTGVPLDFIKDLVTITGKTLESSGTAPTFDITVSGKTVTITLKGSGATLDNAIALENVKVSDVSNIVDKANNEAVANVEVANSNS